MDKYIPFKKLSKQEKRRVYNRKKMQNRKKDLPDFASSFYCLSF